MDLIKYHENLEVYAKMDLVNPPSSKSTKPPKEQCLLALLGGQLVYINIQYWLPSWSPSENFKSQWWTPNAHIVVVHYFSSPPCATCNGLFSQLCEWDPTLQFAFAVHDWYVPPISVLCKCFESAAQTMVFSSFFISCSISEWLGAHWPRWWCA